jgi:hypothetical protein
MDKEIVMKTTNALMDCFATTTQALSFGQDTLMTLKLFQKTQKE